MRPYAFRQAAGIALCLASTHLFADDCALAGRWMVTEIDTPGYSPVGAGINGRGEVVGWYFHSTTSGPPEAQRAFLYRDGELFDLAALAGQDESLWSARDNRASGINDRRQIAVTGPPGSQQRAFRF